jgi:hypothetical protein
MASPFYYVAVTIVKVLASIDLLGQFDSPLLFTVLYTGLQRRSLI